MKTHRPGAAAGSADICELRLYVAGTSGRCAAAITNLQRICDDHLTGRYVLEVIDLQKNPALAREDQIVAIPTLVRRRPAPEKKVIGDLSDEARVLRGLDLVPSPPHRG